MWHQSHPGDVCGGVEALSGEPSLLGGVTLSLSLVVELVWTLYI